MANKYVTIEDFPREPRSTDDAKTSSSSSSCGILPADFQMLYQSRDGKFCLFQTGDGHLSAVQASRFA